MSCYPEKHTSPELFSMKVIIDFNETGLTCQDFNSRNWLEDKILDKEPFIVGKEIYIDRPTHTTATEFFEVVLVSKDLLVVKHCGGVS